MTDKQEIVMRKYIFAISLLLSLSFISGLSAQNLTILHVNDTHSHFEPLRSGENEGMGGVIERAAFVDSVRRADGAGNVLLLHAGDFSQGSSYFTLLKGDLEIATINAMKYDCVALGNHEFDNGIEELTRRVSNLNCPVVCSNYDFSSFELGKYVKDYAILNRGGYKIGIFSLLTDIRKVVDHRVAAKVPMLDAFEVSNRIADKLKNEEKCDIVIALTHIGYEGEPLTDPILVKNTRNIDLVVGGHSHTFLKKMEHEKNLDGKDVPIVQDGCWGLFEGVLKVRKQ